MKITAIDTYIAGNRWKYWPFAKVSTDEGLYGIGEGTVNFAKTAETAIHELKPSILGLDPFIDAPSRFGLGIDLNVEEIRKHPYPQEAWLPFFKAGWERREGQASRS